ncbi:MAG: hypothetical protein O2816_20395, partial [Planctomycetota bacterium]|nr:hypothetical protein [Planctomycetota bacterium]
AAGGLNLAVAAGRLTELGAAPTGAEGLAAAFRNRLKLDLDGAVSALAQEFEDAVSVELRILDLVSAQAQLGKLASLLEVRTGYPAVDALPEGPSRQVLAGTLQRLEVQFSQQRESARSRAVEELDKHLTRTLIPAVVAARDAFRWKDARALLDTQSEWLAQAGIESKLLPEDEQRLIEDGKARLAVVTNTLFPHYKATVDSLQSFLRADEDELREKVERGSLGAAAELSARFEAELTQRAIDRDQVPVDYQTIWPFEGKLKELVEELRDYEARLLEADASEDYAVDLLHVAGLLRSRRYDAALSLWDDRLGDPWRSSVHAAIGQRRREAELLEGLLIQVAKAVRARHDKQLEITLGDIMHRAQVVATRTPEQIVEEGFEVVLPGLEQPVAITLRARAAAGDGVETLPTETLIALSGLNPKDVALDGFVVALFLHYEGRHKAAREHLPGGPFEETVLLAPLQQRIDAALDEQAETDRDRDGEKDRLLRGLQRYARDGRSTPENMLASGELLLSSYRDLLTPEEVLEVQGICVDCRRRLRPPSAEEAFPAATIEKHFSGIVTLTWDFERTGGAWRLGDWFAWDDDGVVRMTVPRETQEDFWDRGRALRLPLGRPLAVDQELDLTMTLAWADEHGDEFDNDVVLSVAGAHLLFVDGPIGRPNRWAVTRQDPRAAFEKLRLDADPRFDGFLGFSRDEPFEVRVKLASSQGRMQVWVDGVELEMPKEPQRAAAPEQPELVLYSKYLLEASRVVLKARLRQ